jgi:hypothetical protein
MSLNDLYLLLSLNDYVPLRKKRKAIYYLP